jgi:FecR protein/LysM domain
MAIGLKSSKNKSLALNNAAAAVAISLGLCCGPLYAEPANTVTQGDNFVYTIQAGDSLLGIRAKFADDRIDWQQVAKLNKISDAKRLPIGKKILIPIEWLASQPAVAKVDSVSGKANINGKPVTPGMLIDETARISTEANSSVVVELSDGSKLRVGSASTIVVDRLKQYHSDQIVEARVRLERGRVEAIVSEKRKKPLDILTPGATAAVRGTHFGVSLEEPSSSAPASLASVDVSKGNVDWIGIKTSAKESLPRGFGSSVNDVGSISKPEALLAPVEVSAFPKEVTKTNSSLSFAAIPGATTYRIQVASDSKFEKLLYENLAPKPRVFLLSNTDGEHFVRINAITANLIEGMEAIAKVNVQARPVAPDGMGPPNATTVYATVASISWLNTPGTWYRVQASKDESFKNPILNDVTQMQQASLSLSPGKTFWRVASIENGKQGPFSDAKFIELRVAPNTPIPKTTENIVELNSELELSEKGNQLEVHLAKDPEFKTGVEVKKLSASPAKFTLAPGKYYIKSRYLIEGFKPDAVPFGPVQNITMIESVRDSFGNTIRSGDGTSIILGR